MDLQERLAGVRPADEADAGRPVRRGQEPDPPRSHRRPRAAAVQHGDEPGGAALPGARRHPRPARARERPRARGPRAAGRRDRRRHPRPRPARAAAGRRHRDGDHGQRPARHLGRAPWPAEPDAGPLQRRVAPAPHHQQDGRPGRAAHRRVLADGRRPAARRQPRERDHPAALAVGAAGDDPEVLQAAPRSDRPRAHRHAEHGDGRVHPALRPRRAQRAHLRGHRLGQDDTAQRALDRDSARTSGS